MQRNYSRRVGASVRSDGVFFELWAPKAARVELVLEPDADRLPMRSVGNGYFEVFVPDLASDALYRYSMDGGKPLPDPASRFQPQGVHGPSQVVDPAPYTWRDAAWSGVPQRDLVFYELHVGTFTAEGTFRGVQQRLGYLKELGITAIELMPVAEFPGRWNWGYDPAALFAPSRAYGTPDDLRALVDAAHEIGLAVFLDVVYNHFGPDGAYAAAYAPFYTDRHQTPWGQAINLDDEDSEGVRAFFIQNALHWLREYHFDGLRLDATHALRDEGPLHFLAELSSAVNTLEGRKRHLVAEDERNLRTLLLPSRDGGFGLDAVWADDFHHQVRNITAGDTQDYFADFAQTTAAQLATTLKQGWFFTGQLSTHQGRPRGTTPKGIALDRFVVCIQNHDQVGNRPAGARLHHEVSPSMYRAASALLLFAPELPLLFMGQEWATSAPFQFFTDHNAELGRLVSAGRKKEFQGFEGFEGEVPDPQDPATFERSRLPWDELTDPFHAGLFRLYQALLKLRRSLIGSPEITVHSDTSLAVWRGRHCLLVALSDGQRLPVPASAELLWHTEQPEFAEHGDQPHLDGRHLVFSAAAAAVFLLPE